MHVREMSLIAIKKLISSVKLLMAPSIEEILKL